jgi:hypothetical protein
MRNIDSNASNPRREGRLHYAARWRVAGADVDEDIAADGTILSVIATHQGNVFVGRERIIPAKSALSAVRPVA